MQQSATSYFADMVLCPLLAVGLAALALTYVVGLVAVLWVLAVFGGAALWTIVEYGMHRLIYHRIAFFKRYHEAHHAAPQAYIGAPPMLGVIVVLVVFSLLALIAPVLANGLAVGMLVGYSAYLCVHHACHFWMPAPGGFLYRLRLRHAAHHYRNDDGNFGVTTSFWDRVFGTRIERAAERSLVV